MSFSMHSHFAMENTLIDVTNAIASRRPSSFNRLRCYVVNYTADYEFPCKIYYNGCSNPRSNGTYCAKASCADHPRRLSRKIYRFLLQLTDSSSSPPVSVCVFDSVQTLMRMSAEELSKRLPEAQLALVREKTSGGEMCDIVLKVKQDTYSGGFVAVVLAMSIVDTVEDEVLAEIFRTPTRSTSIAKSTGEFYTPRAEDNSSGSTSAGQSSSQRRGEGSRSGRSVKLSNVKTKMQDLKIAVIDLTEEED